MGSCCAVRGASPQGCASCLGMAANAGQVQSWNMCGGDELYLYGDVGIYPSYSSTGLCVPQ